MPSLPNNAALVLSRDLRLLAAALDFVMWQLAAEHGLVIVFRAHASSFKALPDSELIFMHSS